MYVQVSKEAITGVRFLGAGVSGRGEPPDVCGRNQALGHSLERQRALGTAAPSPLPSRDL